MTTNKKQNIYLAIVIFIFIIIFTEIASYYFEKDSPDKDLTENLLNIINQDSDLANHIGEYKISPYFKFHPSLSDTVGFEGVMQGTKGSIKFTGVLSKDKSKNKWVIYSVKSEKTSEKCKFCD